MREDRHCCDILTTVRIICDPYYVIFHQKTGRSEADNVLRVLKLAVGLIITTST